MSDSRRLSVLATEYVKIPVRLIEDGEVTDPTSSVVEAAYTAVGTDPVALDWVTASWESNSDRYWARVLTGPTGTIAKAVGTYALWVRITRSPELVVRRSGEVVIT